MANEKWLIDANELMERLKKEHDYLMCDPNVSSKIKWWEAVCFDRVRRTIEKAPTVDAVVRCKECAVPHNQWTGCPKLNGLVPPPDFYCAYGERRTDV